MSQKFFCDNCGEQVKKDQARCPHCGRYFRAVKCPACGFSGSPGLFTDGCPACGYAEEGGAERGGAENAVFSDSSAPEGKERFFSGKFYRRAILLLSVLLLLLAVLFVRLLWS